MLREVKCDDLTRLGCPQGTARIQLRCRAVAATVLLVMLVVRSGFVVCYALGPKVVSKMQAPNLPQDLQKGTKNAAGISKKGSETTKMGPETGTRRPRKGQNGPHGTRRRILVRKRRFPPRKGSSILEPKSYRKSMKKRNEKQCGFRDRFGGRFSRFWLQNGAKMEPKGCQNRSKNAFGSQKRVFAAIHKNKWFQKEKWGSGPSL